MIPGSGGERSSKGTWRYRWGKLTITLEDGSKEEFRYMEGILVRTEAVGDAKVFHRQ